MDEMNTTMDINVSDVNLDAIDVPATMDVPDSGIPTVAQVGIAAGAGVGVGILLMKLWEKIKKRREEGKPITRTIKDRFSKQPEELDEDDPEDDGDQPEPDDTDK